MKIKFVEIKNFRKLQSVRVDFSEKTTLFVGANNSGKTSAMVALGHFLVDKKRFAANDFTLSNWEAINKIGAEWEARVGVEYVPTIEEWTNLLPSLDIWIDAEKNEIHHIRHLVPTLDWAGGLVGVRLQYEPKKILDLYKEYLIAINASKEVKKAANKNNNKTYNLSLWPKDLRDFLDRKLREQFTVKAYLLDPTKATLPKNGIAIIQSLPVGSEALENDPFIHLVKIDEIAAQRGLGDQQSHVDDDELTASRSNKKLSEQMRSYYAKHLDPSEYPSEADLDALEAIEVAQKSFDDRLSSSFTDAIEELSSLNYPGVTDPVMKITTKIKPTDGLKHSAAVQYEISDSASTTPLRLPEEHNGLGYQNLISMVFRLMSFRDAWMRTGKAERQDKETTTPIQPLHLVLVEEPEAHLHAQVQQVFVRKAYDVLRKHKDLGDAKVLHTQMIVSTHSSHVAHETEFACLRYFRRLPIVSENTVPTTAVINLSEVFGGEDDTAKFVARYLKATHCDLFFADAAIMVEGQAERILVPHFIRKNFEKLNRCYVSILEVGGSHAHRLKSLIEHLGLITLIITDIDSSDAEGKAVSPEKNKNQTTGNDTLKGWHPIKTKLDDLLTLSSGQKVKEYTETPLFSVRVAYQVPKEIKSGESTIEICSTTFEDSLILENVEYFKKIDELGIFKKIKKAIQDSKDDVGTLSVALFDLVRSKSTSKGAFALDLLWLDKNKTPLDGLNAPKYIEEGLSWLEKKLTEKQKKVLALEQSGVANES